MSQNGSTSDNIWTIVQMSDSLCACGCMEPVKPGQRWYEPACKARRYRGWVRAGHVADGDRIRELEEELEDRGFDMFELRNKLDALEQAYTRLWEDHQDCQSKPPADHAGQPWVGDAYAVLGVRADAEWEVIEGAYKALVRKYHPDRHPGDPVADFRMKKLTAAYAEVQRQRGHK